jgi:hypothetical protein
MCLAVLVVCRKGIVDPKTHAKRDTGYPGQAMQFLADGHKISILVSQEYRNNSEEFRRI